MAAPNDPMLTQGWNSQTSTGDEDTGLPGGTQFTAGLLGPNEAVMQGYLAQTADPLATVHALSAGLTSGSVYCAKLYLPTPIYVSNVSIGGSAGGTSTLFFTGLYSATGALISTSADLHAGLGTSPLVGAQVGKPIAVPAGFVYAAIMNITGTTTTVSAVTNVVPTAMGGQGLTAAASMTLPLAGATTQRWFIGATGATTALPANLVAAQFAASAVGFWCGLS